MTETICSSKDIIETLLDLHIITPLKDFSKFEFGFWLNDSKNEGLVTEREFTKIVTCIGREPQIYEEFLRTILRVEKELPMEWDDGNTY